MAFVITDPCLGVCDTSCVSVCPVDCIHGPLTVEQIDEIRANDRLEELAEVQLFIDPEICIDCGACEPECPVEAIFEEDDVPGQYSASIESNARFFDR